MRRMMAPSSPRTTGSSSSCMDGANPVRLKAVGTFATGIHNDQIGAGRRLGMDAERRDGVLLLVLHAQVALSLLMLVAAVFGGSVLMKFTQLPGGLYDAAAPTGAERTAAVAFLHMVHLAASIGFLRAMHGPRARPAAIVMLAASLLVLPFGFVGVVLAYKVTQQDAWEPAARRIGGINVRRRMVIGLLWATVAAVSGGLTFGAYVAFLSGAAPTALLLLLAAVAAQWVGLRGLQATQGNAPTFGSPLPELPGADKPSSPPPG